MEENSSRDSKPGCKRLSITLSVLFSFIIGSPFWLKSVEVYRSPLPFDEVKALASSQALTLPCHFNVILLERNVDSRNELELKQSLQNLKHLLLEEISNRISNGKNENKYSHGGCGNNYSVTVTLDHNGVCLVAAGDVSESLAWPCGLSNYIAEREIAEDENIMDEVLYNYSSIQDVGGQYTVLLTGTLMSRRSGHSVVVGKHRHAWVYGEILDSAVVPLVAEVVVSYFMNGGGVSYGHEDGSASAEYKGEMMPLAADGSAVLSFSLLNADPDSWIYGWDFGKLEKRFLSPLSEMLAPVAKISVESQVLYYTPKTCHSYWDEQTASHVFHVEDLPFFVNSNEWHLDTSIAAAGHSKILQFAIYIPSAAECPLNLKLPNGHLSATNGFTSPGWGGVVVFNPSNCLEKYENKKNVRHELSEDDFERVMKVVVGQLRTLLGLPPTAPYEPKIGLSSVMCHETGFSKWELDVLLRRRAAADVSSCSLTLSSLSRLVESLPSMVIKDEIGEEVHQSIEAARMAQRNSNLWKYYATADYARRARAWAETAFFQPSMMSLLYFPIEHHFAIYTPFFVPVMLHTVLAAAKEIRRYMQEKKKFLNKKIL